jgi:hypothetical protein
LFELVFDKNIGVGVVVVVVKNEVEYKKKRDE